MFHYTDRYVEPLPRKRVPNCTPQWLLFQIVTYDELWMPKWGRPLSSWVTEKPLTRCLNKPQEEKIIMSSSIKLLKRRSWEETLLNFVRILWRCRSNLGKKDIFFHTLIPSRYNEPAFWTYRNGTLNRNFDLVKVALTSLAQAFKYQLVKF